MLCRFSSPSFRYSSSTCSAFSHLLPTLFAFFPPSPSSYLRPVPFYSPARCLLLPSLSYHFSVHTPWRRVVDETGMDLLGLHKSPKPAKLKSTISRYLFSTPKEDILLVFNTTDLPILFTLPFTLKVH
ncbi:unnamed protein product [Protopolystoma xenopodis]|uniref:Uncharacterized protein n=1 Tax=Protopolystoma xenopodis TaxID=117903 RepID=A0A448XDG0_9PLAT|nr:unnamed protein product [Protopolystoma xenopodis]